MQPIGNVAGASDLTRRNVIKGIGFGAFGLASALVLASCASPSPKGSAAKAGSVSFGSDKSDDVPRKAYAAFTSAFEKASGNKVHTNVVPNAEFHAQINTYLQASPDDVVSWFAGYRMQYLAQKGLLAPIDDVWDEIGGNFSEGLAKASTGQDGKKYFVPNYNYPWGFFYRKSVWQAKGYEAPQTFDELIALCKKMKADGLMPIAFGDKDGWPAMGTFDYINMRLNGYQFHIDLCAHKEGWDQKKVQDVFDAWKALVPYQDPSSLGKTWQEAAQTLGQGKSGMYLFGSFVTQQYTDKTVLDDIDFFPFPEMAVEGRDAVEAPIDGLVLSKKGGQNSAARDMLQFMGTPAGQEAYFSIDKSNLMTAKGADLSAYSDLNKKCSDAIASAKMISQFFDRDALPAMANNVMIPALQTFLKDGTVDTKNLEAQAKALYAAQ
ncbi:extracellular solute-binding protein [Parafrigoribacterium mesophilum]|uniref:ABC transporter substrate-binding protein n=1 Tax=Parafrigoribacterium mesophilum TaxID=433646 RepID=UPI0031FBF06C